MTRLATSTATRVAGRCGGPFWPGAPAPPLITRPAIDSLPLAPRDRSGAEHARELFELGLELGVDHAGLGLDQHAAGAHPAILADLQVARAAEHREQALLLGAQLRNVLGVRAQVDV